MSKEFGILFMLCYLCWFYAIEFLAVGEAEFRSKKHFIQKPFVPIMQLFYPVSAIGN